MIQIPLTNGYVCQIDDEDYPLVAGYKWFTKTGKPLHTQYAIAHVRKITGQATTIRLHKILLPKRGNVDHIDGNGLNNCRSNLRYATTSQNHQNRRKLAGQSKYKGVCRYVQTKIPGWRASLKLNKKAIYLGVFTDEREAARAYDTAARKYFGEFARVNFSE